MNTLMLKPEHLKILQFNKEIVDKWVAALRSNKWVQHTGAMTDPSIPNSACCLMVAEAECNNKTVEDYYSKFENQFGYQIDALPTSKESPLYLKIPDSDDFWFPESLEAKFVNQISGTGYTPAQWNDSLKLSFEQIATLLETGSVTFE
jgi:hypothetical protein